MSSHCIITGRLPAEAIEAASRSNRYVITTSIVLDEDRQYKASLHAYLEHPPQVNTLFQVEASFANNGGSEIMLGSDSKDMEVLGQDSPSDPDYLITCPAILPPKLNIIGVVGNVDMSVQYHTFTVAGTSYIDNSNQPFTIKVRVDKSSARWANFRVPSPGNSIYVSGVIVDREQDDKGLFIIELGRITYLPGGSRTAASKTPTKGEGTGGTNWMKTQQSARKRKRQEEEKSKDEDFKGEGPSTPTRTTR